MDDLFRQDIDYISENSSEILQDVSVLFIHEKEFENCRFKTPKKDDFGHILGRYRNVICKVRMILITVTIEPPLSVGIRI